MQGVWWGVNAGLVVCVGNDASALIKYLAIYFEVEQRPKRLEDKLDLKGRGTIVKGVLNGKVGATFTFEAIGNNWSNHDLTTTSIMLVCYKLGRWVIISMCYPFVCNAIIDHNDQLNIHVLSLCL